MVTGLRPGVHLIKYPGFHIPGVAKTNLDFCIFRQMKTMLNLRDDLVAEAKALAARERTTLKKIVEEGLALRLRGQRRADVGRWRDLPVSARRGGFRQGIDATSNRSLFDAADE
jgi:hypothetical protein